MAFRLTPRDTVFYDLFAAAGHNIVAAAEALRGLLAPDARPAEIAARLVDIEHEGDSITHTILNQLNSSFVTPFDREDIYRLASNLDDVVDWMEAAADMVVLTGLSTLPQPMAAQIELLAEAATATADAMSRLRTLKDLESYWIDVNRIENEADQAYRQLISRLFSGEYDPLTLLKLKAVGDNLEEAADALEHVAHAVETIAVKES